MIFKSPSFHSRILHMFCFRKKKKIPFPGLHGCLGVLKLVKSREAHLPPRSTIRTILRCITFCCNLLSDLPGNLPVEVDWSVQNASHDLALCHKKKPLPPAFWVWVRSQNYQPSQADDLFPAKLLKAMKSVGCPDPNLASESSYSII